MKKGTITFNEYKTFKNYGTQTFKLPSTLLKIIKQYVKFIHKFAIFDSSTYDYLIITNSQSTIDVTKMLNDIFKPKRISVNMIRHSFLTNFYSGDMPPLEDMNKLADQMSHSISQALLYIRKTK